MNLSVFKRVFCCTAVAFLIVASLPIFAAAGAKVKIDETKYFQIGMGYRGSLTITEDAATNGTDHSFNPATENIRLYTVAQVHKNIQVEFNTELSNPDNTGSDTINLLDAVAKLDLGFFDLWLGRQLPPSDRLNMDGPFYLNAAYSYPMVQSFGNLGISAGRDNGFAFHGDAAGGKFEWAYGVFEGTSGGSDLDDNVRHTARIDIALGDPEPGFYTGSTYFGAKKLTTLGVVFHHEKDGVGSASNQGDFTGVSG
ncbi:MAG: hypothetical protein MK234_06710, partial [Nitrospinales bacterium]|nr:hypothetical protein [Nitrospinales bacterium]